LKGLSFRACRLFWGRVFFLLSHFLPFAEIPFSARSAGGGYQASKGVFIWTGSGIPTHV
jgi:hypothetical protein